MLRPKRGKLEPSDEYLTEVNFCTVLMGIATTATAGYCLSSMNIIAAAIRLQNLTGWILHFIIQLKLLQIRMVSYTHAITACIAAFLLMSQCHGPHNNYCLYTYVQLFMLSLLQMVSK